MIRQYKARAKRYPELKRVELREFEAVRAAVERTEQLPDGKWRVKLIDKLYWQYNRKNIDGAAMDLFISRRTALRWSAEFTYLVAEEFGLYDPE
jgi:hypothetical protein